MTGRKHLILFLLLVASLGVSAQSKWNNFVDKAMQLPVVGLVYPTFSNETSWRFNLGAQACFYMPNETTPSVMRLTAYYSLKRQWQIYSTGTLYMGGKIPWMLYYGIRYRDYPDVNFEWVDGTPIAFDYASKRADLTLEPLFHVSENWLIGPMCDFIWEKTNLNIVDSLYHGTERVLMWGLGFGAMYDTRNINQYPTKGMVIKLEGLYYEPKLGSDYRLWHLELDYRHYLKLWQPAEFKNDFDKVNKSLIFAYQFKAIAALSNQSVEDMPFQVMPTLGGDDLLRGIRTNLFRENVLWALQTELRFPIYSILRGTVFAGVGDVYDTDHWQWTAPQIGYGLGLRLAINKAHVNVRFDVARNNRDKSWSDPDTYSFILTATEAF
ncbi:MAG: outer membrane protein assembly factor [Paludibacteraceae bacterium]|nr:outer membrane protein assembly factor [Paludibacteraceae bacterium]